MRVADCTWFQIEEYLQRDDRVVLPLGSTEQHGYLSLETDNILGERVAAEAAEPSGVPVLPILPYGITPAFGAFPGSPSLRMETFLRVLGDLLDSLYAQGFRRFLLLNAHGGNAPAAGLTREWAADRAGAQVIFHNWWLGARVVEAAEAIDRDYAHANWGEDFPWTRLEGIEPPGEPKPMLDEAEYRVASPQRVRELIGDGSFGGLYRRSDEEMLRVWAAGVEETRDLLEHGWRP